MSVTSPPVRLTAIPFSATLLMSLSLLTLPALRSLFRGLPISYLPYLRRILASSALTYSSPPLPSSPYRYLLLIRFPFANLFSHQTLSMDNSAGDNNPTSTALSLRPHRPAGASSSGGGREDCWSEGATAVLIEAWGERHLRCNRGNLRQNDWREVADAVNVREDGSKPPKSDIQCKNRIDTLKKKYKIEKAKTCPSSWRFFNRIDYLIGPGGSSGAKKFGAVLPPELAGGGGSGKNRFRLNSSCHDANPNSSTVGNSNRLWSRGSSSRFNSPESSDESESSLRSAGDTNHGGRGGIGVDLAAGRRVQRGRKHGRLEEEGYVVVPPAAEEEEEETAFQELAKAILKFGEIYERIERSKQKQMMELEKQRMELTKEIEFQRLNMIMDAQLEMEKLKRAKNASTAGKKL